MSDKDFRPLQEYYDSIANSYRPGEYEKLYNNYHSSLAEYNKLSAEKKLNTLTNRRNLWENGISAVR